jgi:chemotaxis protein methyltransferase CheR
MNGNLPLSPPVFAILSGLIEERLGIFFSAEDRELFASKVSPRCIERGFDSLLDYYYYLRYDPGAETELAALAEALVVNETYFAREPDQLAALVDTLLPSLLEGGRSLRLWSAACSTGEEPLTVAGMLAARKLLHRVELVATDVSSRVLAFARQGRFGARSLRALPASARDWFEYDGSVAVVRPELQRSVRFERVNLLDSAAVARLGRFDVILCRNVLIYFRDSTTSAVIGTLEQALNPGGYLLVGVSESLLRFGTRFTCEEHGGAFFYRKAVP